MNMLDHIFIILVEPKNEENIGSVARVMKNFGLTNLVLINPRCEIGEKAYVTATHASDVLDSAIFLNSFHDLKKFINLLFATSGKPGKSERKNIRKYITPKSMIEIIKESLPCNIGIVFGREDIGLTNEEIVSCDHLVYIPTNPKFPIMNLSHAVAVICYELFINLFDLNNYIKENYKLANFETKKLLIEKLLGFINIEEEKKEFIKRVLLRCRIFTHEAKKILSWLK